MEQFAEHGFDGATIRGIANAAGVSAGLLRHHFGSKEQLREACDAYALSVLRGYHEQSLTDDGLNNPKTVTEAQALLPYALRRYIARALIEQSETAAQIFDEMAVVTEQGLAQTDLQRPDSPVADLRARAALTVAMSLGVSAFQAHISRVIGADIFSPEGDRRITLALLDILSHPALSPDTARALQQAVGDGDS